MFCHSNIGLSLTGTFSVPKEFAANKNENEKIKVDSVLYIGQEKFAVVGFVFIKS